MSPPPDVAGTAGSSGPGPTASPPARSSPAGGGAGLGRPWAVTGARVLGLGRVGLGITAVVAPRLPLWPWVGWEAARSRPARLLAQALGVRDVALGAGLVLALRRGAPARGWVEAGGLADLGDATITLLSFRRLPRRSRWAVLAAAGGGALAAPLLARLLPPPEPTLADAGPDTNGDPARRTAAELR